VSSADERREVSVLQNNAVPISAVRMDLPPPGGVAWLEVTGADMNGSAGRARTGPLGMQIAPLVQSRAPYFLKSARLRGTRCVLSVSTVSGAELSRAPRTGLPGQSDNALHLLARIDAIGSVFDTSTATGRGTLRVVDASDSLSEHFMVNAHLFTLNVPQAGVGVDAGALAEMMGQTFELTAFQESLLRSSVPMLLFGANDLARPASIVGVDRYLCAMAGLLLRTVVARPAAEPEQLESVRARTDAIIFEQASDATLTPATIAAQLNISLRQLYRAFNRTESPAARIRRRRLERAAELLSARSPQPQVERVAQECGFASAEYFSRAFRREFGISPRAYRSAHREPGVNR
jgi:AraC-like DNA-binding protein